MIHQAVTLDKTFTVHGNSQLLGDVTTQDANIDAGQGSVTAANLLYGIGGGPGIAVSGGQHPIITNSGVLSLNGQHGAVALKAGTGVAIDGLTISSTVSFPSLIGVSGGGTGVPSLTSYGVLYGNGTAPVAALDPGVAGFVLQSNGTSAAPSWVAATGISAGNVPFSGITSGTNTTASMLVGSGASLGYTGLGTINASSLLGNTWATPGAIGSSTANTGAFTTLLASGGMTISSLTANGGVLYTNGSGTVAQTSAGTSGTVLHGGSIPAYSLLALGSEVSGTLPVLSGGTGVTTPANALANLGGESAFLSGTTVQYFRGDKTFQALTTTVVPEGASLYYTQGRFDAALSGKTTTNLAEGSNLYYTDVRARNALSVSGPLIYNSGTGAFSLGTIGVGNGGTGQSTLTQYGMLYGNGTSPVSALTPGTPGYLLQSNGTTAAPSWIAASGLSAGSVAFSGITSGTNTTALMLVGTGASLNFTGSGTINASSLLGNTWAVPGAIGSTTPNTGSFSTLAVASYPFTIKGTSTGAGNTAYDWYMTQVGDAIDQGGAGTARVQLPTIGYGHNRNGAFGTKANLYIERDNSSPGGTAPYKFNDDEFGVWVRSFWPALASQITSTDTTVGGSSAGNHALQNSMQVTGSGFGDSVLEVNGYGGMINGLFVNTQGDPAQPTIFPKYAAHISVQGSTANDSIGFQLDDLGTPQGGNLFLVNSSGGNLFKINGPLNAPGGSVTAGGAYGDVTITGNMTVAGTGATTTSPSYQASLNSTGQILSTWNQTPTFTANDATERTGFKIHSQPSSAFNQTLQMETQLVSMQANPPSGVTYNDATGLYVQTNHAGAGAVTTERGIDVIGITNFTGSLGTLTGLNVRTPFQAQGTPGVTYDLYVNPQTIGTSAYGIRIDGANTAALWLSGNTADATSGIAFGSSRDANLYRSASGTLRTDTTLIVGTAFQQLGSGNSSFAGNLGIGVTAPINKLGVAGGVAIGSYAGVNTAPSNGMIVSGNVGINTSAPTHILQIGPASAQHLAIDNSEVDVRYATSSKVYLTQNANMTFALTLGETGAGGIRIGGPNGNAYLSENTNSLILNGAGGNVGIGTTAPGGLLQIAAGTTATAPLVLTGGTNTTTPVAGAMEWDGTNLYVTQTSGPTRKTVAFTDSAITGSLGFDKLTTGTNTTASMTVGTGASLTAAGSGSINATQLLGNTWAAPGTIGGTTPGAATFTTITGNTTASISGTLTIGNGALIQPAYGPLQLAYKSGANAWSTGMTLQDTTGNVGIATTSPQSKLHIANGASGQTPLALTVATLESNTNTYLSLLTPNANQSGIMFGAPQGVAQGQITYSQSGNFMNFYVAGTNAIRITTNGNVGLGTTTPTLGPLQMASGAYVTSGGVWTNASDRNLKTNFTPLDAQSILAKIDTLPVPQWNYKSEDAAIRHIGPVAQDFYSIFGVGNTDTSISTIDPAGIALLGIQALDQKYQTLAAQIGSAQPGVTTNVATQTTVDGLNTSLLSLADRVNALEKQQATLPASFSATLSSALQGVSLSVDKDATVSGKLFVQGRTTLNDLGVTGDITAGVLAIHGLDGTIDAIGNTLKLQSLGTGSIDLLAGKVTVDANGNVIAKGEITAKKINIDESDPASASSGNGILKSGSTAITATWHPKGGGEIASGADRLWDRSSTPSHSLRV
jgi:hypothetical protein